VEGLYEREDVLQPTARSAHKVVKFFNIVSDIVQIDRMSLVAFEVLKVGRDSRWHSPTPATANTIQFPETAV